MRDRECRVSPAPRPIGGGGVPCCVQQDGGEPIPPHPYLRGFGGTWYIEARAAVESDSVRPGEDNHLRESKPGQQNLIEEAAGAHDRARVGTPWPCGCAGARTQLQRANSRIVRSVSGRSAFPLRGGRWTSALSCVSRLYRAVTSRDDRHSARLGLRPGERP